MGRAADATLKFKAKIPKSGVTVSTMTVKATKKIGTASAVDAGVTGSAIPAITDIGTENVVIKFTPELAGNWLTDANKKFTYSLITAADDETALDPVSAGVNLATDGTLTITSKNVPETTREDGTNGLKLFVKVEHNKAQSGTYDADYTTAKKEVIAVTVKFNTTTSAKAKLDEKNGSAWKWNETNPVKVSYEKNASNAWVIVDEADLKKDLIDKANTWLSHEDQKHSGFTLKVAELKFDDTTAPTKATVKFDVERTGDTKKTTDAIDLVIVKTEKQLKAEADTLAKGTSVKTAIEALSVTGTDLSTAADAERITAVQGKIDETTAIGNVLTTARAELKVIEAKINADGDKLKIKYTVKITENGVSGTCEPVSAEVGYSAS